MKNVKEATKVVVEVLKESGKDLLVYASVGAVVIKGLREISKAKDYFDKK